MNKRQLFVAGLSAALVFTACKKQDVQNEAPEAAVAAPVAEWKSVGNWSAQSQDKYTVYSTTIEDKNITASVAASGLVLAYKKSANGTTALPFEEKGTEGSYFWYYQVSEGNFQIVADAYGKAVAPSADQGFNYFVVTAEKLNELNEKGYTKAELMKLTYETAAALLK